MGVSVLPPRLILYAVAIALCAPLAGCTASDDGSPQSRNTRFEWKQGNAGDATPLRNAVSRLVDTISAGRYGSVRSLFVAHGDTIVADTAFLPAARGIQPFFSVAKTITATLVSIAIDRGEIGSLDNFIIEYLPDSLRSTADRNGWSAVSFRDLLGMTTGIVWDEVGMSIDEPRSDFRRLMAASDPVAFVISRRIVDPPGTRFTYCSGATLQLSRVLETATGRNAASYAREFLFRPMGIDSVIWLDIAGMTNTATGLAMKSSDIARVGRLYLNGGMWEGRRLLDSGWISLAWSPRADPTDAAGDFYGLGWFGIDLDSIPAAATRPPAPGGGRGRMLYAFGHRDQVLAVLPSEDLIVVVTADHRNDEYERMGVVRMILENFVLR